MIVGLGITGLSCARYFQRRGRPFCIVDTRAQPPGLAELKREMPQVPVYLGEVPDAVLEGEVELIVSPGIAMNEPLVIQAQKAGAAVIGDIDLFVREAVAPVIGITGSNAKSTVTELVGQMAEGAGLNVGVGGNLGTPALDLLDRKRELYVLELSSFQLERSGELNLAVATVLNISEDHLDRHGNMQLYRRAKQRIFKGARKVVYNRDDPLTAPLISERGEAVSWCMDEPERGGFGLRQVAGEEYFCHQFDELMSTRELGLKGRHNIANALAALAIGHSAGLRLPAMLESLRRFRGLPHRCSQLAERYGVRFVDDSKGTNPGATQAALEGLGGDHNVILIAGGQGKGADFSSLKSAVAKHCKMVVLIGEAARQMQRCWGDYALTAIESSLERAVALAAENADSGDLVLLSPACASFDMFSDYVERGEVFARAVAELQGEAQ
ncbi:MAG: UDP-N-acetylmuramoyl-L-alanine--D-glutamate ligase [Halieaceae bacterium]|nr:UDP-N-acetylmuramoyl-L-alanine--D-glutamate ligase [Halieaceae bacterium]